MFACSNAVLNTGFLTDVQLLTVALAVIIPLSLLIYSNSRITEMKETLRAEMKSMTSAIQNGFNRVHADIESLRVGLQIHVLEHHK